MSDRLGRKTVLLGGHLGAPPLLLALVVVDGWMRLPVLIGLGFTLYFIRNFAQILGESGQIPVLLAAWGPPVASILLPLGLLLHLEDG